jgi:dienelactone hydrolase
MRALVRSTAIIVLAVASAVIAQPYWNTTALILRAADTPGLAGQLARLDAYAVGERSQSVPTRTGAIDSRLFFPAPGARRSVLLVSGVHPDGLNEPRLRRLANDLAAAGVNVLIPEVHDLVSYRLTAQVTDTIEDTASWMASRHDLFGPQAIGIIGVSFSGGLSIVAAGRPGVRGKIAYVLSFGGHGNLPRVLRYLCTGIEPALDGHPGVRRPPHDYALAILLHQAAELMVPHDQVDPLRSAIETFVRASAVDRTDKHKSDLLFAKARTLEGALPDPSRMLMHYVNERDVAALGGQLLPYLDRLGTDPALSPDQSPAPSAPVYLLHGSDDNVIPAVEAELLARRFDGRTRVRYLLSRFLTHVDVAARPTLGDTWEMIAFWKAALNEGM